MFTKKYTVPINTLRIDHTGEFDDGYIYISSRHISPCSSEKMKRNEIVQIKNHPNGTIIHAPVRSNKRIKYNEICLSYELASQLNISNIRDAFAKEGMNSGINVNLRIQKLSALVYLKESVMSGNKVTRILSTLAILSVINTLISIAGHIIDGLNILAHSTLAASIILTARNLAGL